jgi:hypothetical protein
MALGQGDLELDVSDLPAAVYVIVLRDSKAATVILESKFIKQ